MKAAASNRFPAHPDLCPALHHLVQEHTILRDKQEELLQFALLLQQSTLSAPYKDILIKIRNKVRLFYTLLSLHAQKEEKLLFPILRKYLRNEAGSVAAMICEHEQLRFHLTTFLNHTKHIDELIPRAEVRSLIYHLMEISEIITKHFDKEENMLYPLAERLLSEKEKQMLSQQLFHIVPTSLLLEKISGS